MNFTILVDTGFWIALLDNKLPQHAEDALKISVDIETEQIIVPFPTLYEFVNSRLSRRGITDFESILKRPNVILFDDSKYKFEALEIFFQKSKYYYNDNSFVDEILKLIMNDINVGIDFIVSFDIELVNYARSRNINTI